jgi:hypothetical protein
MEVSGQLHAPTALTTGKSPRYSLDMRLDGPQNRSGRGEEEKKSLLSPCQESNPGRRPTRSLVTTLTELPQLLD